MALNQLQNFYKATLSAAVSFTGAGKIYVSVLPTVFPGYLVISASNSTKREIIYYDTTGTDGNGNYVNVPNAGSRGMGGTTAQTHDIQESIRMNITAQHWADMITEVVTNLPASIAALAASIANKADLILNNIFQGISTFVQSPIIPDATLANHPVSLSQLNAAILAGASIGLDYVDIRYNADGTVGSMHDNVNGITYIFSYDANGDISSIYDGRKKYSFVASSDGAKISNITR